MKFQPEQHTIDLTKSIIENLKRKYKYDDKKLFNALNIMNETIEELIDGSEFLDLSPIFSLIYQEAAKIQLDQVHKFLIEFATGDAGKKLTQFMDEDNDYVQSIEEFDRQLRDLTKHPRKRAAPTSPIHKYGFGA